MWSSGKGDGHTLAPDNLDLNPDSAFTCCDGHKDALLRTSVEKEPIDQM